MGKKVLIDLTGQRFGMLTVLRRGEDRVYANGQHHPTWICRCDCGAVVERLGDSLRRGEPKNCGCVGRSRGGFIGVLKPLPAPLTVQYKLEIGRTYKVKGKRLRLVGIYHGFARFETQHGFHECYMFSELEGKI